MEGTTIRRDTIGWGVGIAALAIFLVGGGWYAFVEWPRRQAVEAARIELTETIPQRLTELTQAIESEAAEAGVVERAAAAATVGRTAAASGNAEVARGAVTELDTLLSNLRLTYEVRIVSRTDVPSGVTRPPAANQTAENAYLIVEALAPDGNAIPRTIRSEEDQSLRTVTLWGVRVPEVVFDRVERDKLDDGIVQDSLVGAKERGRLDIDWVMPVLGGMITEW